MKFFNQRSAVAATESPLAWPLPFAALAVSLWVSVVFWSGLIAAFTFVWITTPNNSGTFAGALAAATTSFLHAHFLPIKFELFELSVFPVLLTFILLWLIQAATKWAIRSVIFYHPASVLGLIAGVGGVHGALLFLISLTTSGAINSTMAVANGFLFGVVGAAIAVLRSSAEPILEIPKSRFEIGERTKTWLKPQSPYLLVRDLLLMLPEPLRIGFGFATKLFGYLGALAFGLMLLVSGFRFGEFMNLVDLIAADSSSKIAVIMWSILYLPVLFVWALFLLLGTNLQIGLGSSYSIFEQSVAPLPVVPVLALLPESLPSWSWIGFGLALFIALFATRRMFSGHLRAKFDLGHALKINAATTGFFLLMILILNLVVTGSIGAGRFEFVGFSNLQVLQFGLLNVSTAVLFRTALWWLTARRAQTSLATG